MTPSEVNPTRSLCTAHGPSTAPSSPGTAAGNPIPTLTASVSRSRRANVLNVSDRSGFARTETHRETSDANRRLACESRAVARLAKGGSDDLSS